MAWLIYQLFAALAGWLEAILYARRGAESFSGNEHGGMTWQRIAVVLFAAAAVLDYLWLGPWLLLAELPALAGCFPAVHDEAYNFTRLWISHRGWMPQQNRPSDNVTDRQAWQAAWQEYRYGYQSPTTTARTDFNGRQRTGLAVAGLLAYLGALAWLVLR